MYITQILIIVLAVQVYLYGLMAHALKIRIIGGGYLVFMVMCL